jgi:hypothetical protein
MPPQVSIELPSSLFLPLQSRISGIIQTGALAIYLIIAFPETAHGTVDPQTEEYETGLVDSPFSRLMREEWEKQQYCQQLAIHMSLRKLLQQCYIEYNIKPYLPEKEASVLDSVDILDTDLERVFQVLAHISKQNDVSLISTGKSISDRITQHGEVSETPSSIEKKAMWMQRAVTLIADEANIYAMSDAERQENHAYITVYKEQVLAFLREFPELIELWYMSPYFQRIARDLGISHI